MPVMSARARLHAIRMCLIFGYLRSHHADFALEFRPSIGQCSGIISATSAGMFCSEDIQRIRS
jgi:hypothetical protein